MIFLDSSFLISVEVDTDQNHKKASVITDGIASGKYGMPAISDYIFDEVITVTFGRTKDLEKAVLVGEKLNESAEMIKIEDLYFREAWEIFKDQKDTRLSFTDCTTLALMRGRGIKTIATFDGDFKKVKGITVV
ncbi:MAG: type II toxin-antitoxin system VapC family toxin [Candidatus Aenigmarchaeota archaeon]|nr:type II toxin-antitoxin system VapC family toxin [Candidatus Aenigmarchaeota archaeon]